MHIHAVLCVSNTNGVGRGYFERGPQDFDQLDDFKPQVIDVAPYNKVPGRP